MTRRRIAATTLLVLAPFAGAQSTAAQSTRNMADVLPASTYFCASFAGSDACAGAAKSLDVAKLIAAFLHEVPAETVEQHITRDLDRAADQLRTRLARIGLSPAALRAVLRRPMAFGIGRLTLRGFGPSVALVIDETGAGAELDQITASLQQAASRFAHGFHAGSRKVGGATVQTIENELGFAVLFAHEHGLFVVTNSEGYLREIGAVAAGTQPSLARESVLGSQRKQLAGRELAGMFVNSQRLLSMFDDHLPYESAEIGDALGVHSIGGWYYGCGVDGGTTSELSDLAMAGPSTGLLKAAFSNGGVDLGAAALCSKDAVAFGTLHLHLPAVLQALHRVVDLLPPALAEHVQHGMQHELAGGFHHLGVTPEQVHELLGALGGSVSFGLNIGALLGPIPVPEPLLLVPVKDEAVVRQWLDRICEMSAQMHGLQWKTRKVGSTDVRYCEIAAGIALSPSFALADGYLIASSQTKNVVAALRQKSDASSSLASAEDLQAAVKQSPGASGFLHVRGFRLVELGWRTFDTMVLSQLEAHERELGFGREAIPDQEAFAKALGTTTWSLTVDDRGAHARAVGFPLGNAGLLAGLMFVFDDVLGRAAGKIY
jgi:hypothetical protein